MTRILKNIIAGLAAGAIGTLILNVVTYADMLVRGRSSSGVPAQLAGVIGEMAHIEQIAKDVEEPQAQNRRTATGALMGYATGLGIGLAYGSLRAAGRPAPVPLSGLALGGAAMAASDVPATVAGVTNPKQWGMSGWMSDIVPHVAYGLATAGVYEALTRGDGSGSSRDDR